MRPERSRQGRGQWLGRKGQVLVLYTLALMLMFGMLALAVELGLTYHAKKEAQSAADAAAMAAVLQAFSLLGQNPITAASCPAGITCSVTNFSCNSSQTKAQVASNNLAAGCVYAAQQGFVDGVNGRAVKLDAGLGSPPGTNVAAEYWVRARVVDTKPALFAFVAMMASTDTAAARATAALVNKQIDASLVLTNRESDPALGGDINQGVNLTLGGGGKVVVPGGVLMASKGNGVTSYGSSTPWAEETTGGGGSAEVDAAFAWINSVGKAEDPGIFYDTSGTIANPPVNKPDGQNFYDPMRGKGQPMATMSGLPVCPVIGGAIQGPITLAPAIYYAASENKQTGAISPTYGPISLKGSGIHFAAKASGTVQPSGFGSQCPQGDWSGGSSSGQFGNYVFYGGLTNRGSGGSTYDAGDIMIQNGMYFIAGIKWGNNSGPQQNDRLFDLGSNMTVSDGQAAGKVDQPGEIFVLTDPNYPGLPTATTSQLPANVNWTTTLNGLTNTLKQGPSNIQAGSGATSLNLHGINKENSTIAGTALEKFDRVILWQDQRNSAVEYDSSGNVACLDGYNHQTVACPKSASDRNADNVDPKYDSTRLKYQGSSSTQLWGIFYQPRGAYLYVAGGGTSGAKVWLQIVTGAVFFGGSGQMHVEGVMPIARQAVALVE